MGLTALLRPLGAAWLILAAAGLIGALSAYALAEDTAAIAFLVMSGMAGFAGGALMAATQGMPVRARAIEALGLGLLIFLTAPVFAAIPFIMTMQDGVFSDALFEAASALTTTGASLADPAGEMRVIIFWRCLLSWMGGYATLLLAAAIFAALDRDAPAIRRSALLTVSANNVFSHLPVAARRIGWIYLLLTGIIWLGLLFGGAELYTAICLSFSAISTGGVGAGGQGLGMVLSPLGVSVMVAGCMAGATNISLFWDVLRDRRVLTDPDVAGMAALIVGLAAVYLIAAPGPGPIAHLIDAVFVVTTAGYSLAGEPAAAPVAALFAALIGGAAASTAGGVKISRILLLWRRLGAELRLLSDPSAVERVRHRGQHASDAALIAVWSYVLAFAATLGVGGVLLAASGAAFDHAFAAVSAALANAGPLLALTMEDADWSDLPETAKFVLIPVMIMGRLEVLAALSAVWALLQRR